MHRTASIVFAATFFFMCAGSLFLSTPLFVGEHVAPKWYGAIFCTAALLLAYVIFSFFAKEKMAATEKSMQAVCFIVSVTCVAQAAYGILQHAHAAPASGGFRVTGSFDNPAGFAACLCAGFPLVLYFIFREKSWKLYVAIAAGIIAVAAVILSASRAGVASLIAVGLAVFLHKVRVGVKWKWVAAPALLLALLSGLYFLKKDSADGRLLIWRCSWEMVKDKPLLGHGYGGFKAHYMNVQAKYFEEHPDSKYAMLADNVNRPFNEYILLLTNYGFVGFVLLLAACWFLWKSFLRGKHEPVVRLAGCCLLSIAVFAFFSYPLQYPFVWVMLILSVAAIIDRAKYPVKIPNAVAYPVALLTILAAILCGWVTYRRMANEMLWCKVAHKSLMGKTKQMLPTYDSLYKSLAKNELFLYNYAAELSVAADYGKSLQVARECEQLWADYDLQMLMADNYEKLNQYEEAEGHYRKAAAMCPAKFMPLYRLAKLCDATDRRSEALALARLIIGKKVKILSSTVAAIKREMQQLVEGEENRKPAAQDKVSNPPNTEATRQGEAPEVQPRGSALPP